MRESGNTLAIKRRCNPRKKFNAGLAISGCALRLTRWTRCSASGVVGWLRPVPRGSIPRSLSLVKQGAIAVSFEFLIAHPVRGCPRNLTLRRLFPGDLTKYEFLYRGSLGFFPGLGWNGYTKSPG